MEASSSMNVGAGLIMRRKQSSGYTLKEQCCHLPGFLGITILVAGSACQPWLTTPVDKEKIPSSANVEIVM